MNIVILRGALSSTPVVRELPSGSRLHTLEVTTPVEGENAASVRVVCIDPRRPMRLDVGDEVGVIGVVRRRFYRSGAGAQSATEVVADHVVAIRRSSDVARLLSAAARRLDN